MVIEGTQHRFVFNEHLIQKSIDLLSRIMQIATTVFISYRLFFSYKLETLSLQLLLINSWIDQVENENYSIYEQAEKTNYLFILTIGGIFSAECIFLVKNCLINLFRKSNFIQQLSNVLGISLCIRLFVPIIFTFFKKILLTPNEKEKDWHEWLEKKKTEEGIDQISYFLLKNFPETYCTCLCHNEQENLAHRERILNNNLKPLIQFLNGKYYAIEGLIDELRESREFRELELREFRELVDENEEIKDRERLIYLCVLTFIQYMNSDPGIAENLADKAAILLKKSGILKKVQVLGEYKKEAEEEIEKFLENEKKKIQDTFSSLESNDFKMIDMLFNKIMLEWEIFETYKNQFNFQEELKEIKENLEKKIDKEPEHAIDYLLENVPGWKKKDIEEIARFCNLSSCESKVVHLKFKKFGLETKEDLFLHKIAEKENTYYDTEGKNSSTTLKERIFSHIQKQKNAKLSVINKVEKVFFRILYEIVYKINILAPVIAYPAHALVGFTIGIVYHVIQQGIFGKTISSYLQSKDAFMDREPLSTRKLWPGKGISSKVFDKLPIGKKLDLICFHLLIAYVSTQILGVVYYASLFKDWILKDFYGTTMDINDFKVFSGTVQGFLLSREIVKKFHFSQN